MRTGTALRDTGDGFARLNLDNFVLTEVMASVAAVRPSAALVAGGTALTRALARQTPINGTYPLPAASLDGANVWLLEYIAGMAGMSFSYEVVFVPDAIFYANRTVQLDYVLNVLGYDCMLDSTVLRGEELAYARFLVPNERFGLSVVTSLSAPADYPVIAMLFAWTAPFTWQARPGARHLWVTVDVNGLRLRRRCGAWCSRRSSSAALPCFSSKAART